MAVWVDHETREVMSGLPDRARLTLTCHLLIFRLECLKVFEGGRLLVWRGGVDRGVEVRQGRVWQELYLPFTTKVVEDAVKRCDDAAGVVQLGCLLHVVGHLSVE